MDTEPAKAGRGGMPDAPHPSAPTPSPGAIRACEYLEPWSAEDARCLEVFFFFQAEDGIRDLTVTGVQTCALPIFNGPFPILAGKYGSAGDQYPAYAAYDSDLGTPAYGDSWGAKSGTWKLAPNREDRKSVV